MAWACRMRSQFPRLRAHPREARRGGRTGRPPSVQQGAAGLATRTSRHPALFRRGRQLGSGNGASCRWRRRCPGCGCRCGPHNRKPRGCRPCGRPRNARRRWEAASARRADRSAKAQAGRTFRFPPPHASCTRNRRHCQLKRCRKRPRATEAPARGSRRSTRSRSSTASRQWPCVTRPSRQERSRRATPGAFSAPPAGCGRRASSSLPWRAIRCRRLHPTTVAGARQGHPPLRS
mmetsp:Transcript_22122/g.62012  ORF Transcript_22122/g.62012 Transcript_22122/m.62012 type:complete len:234 (-) Transcript_22122:695-1396(-)